MSVVKNVAKKVGGALLGTKGSPGRAPGYLLPEFEEKNLQAAQGAFDTAARVRGERDRQLGAIANQFVNLQAEASPQAQAEAEIQRRRAALGIAQGSEQRAIESQIARRGLGNSAAGLFASAQAKRGQAQDLANLSASRGTLERELANERLARQKAILGQYGDVAGSVIMPGVEFKDAGVAPTQGSSGLLGKAAGAAAGAFFNPIGGAIGTGLRGLGQRAVGGVQDLFARRKLPGQTLTQNTNIIPGYGGGMYS